eukprot:TRINITY_DN17124_c0_g1_i1.p1 TRINITY_DN17124_c0_g1~~TRINITY_DN17124_c0_g1_i1.p1  ORF type:complete len:627 (+),score=200.79 TRINITY_DN17124_c0_g1_i1:59-1882(+)
MKGYLSILLLTIALVFGQTFDGITNKDITRTVDLTSQFAKQTSVITVSNTGSKSVDTYFFTAEESFMRHLAYYEVRDASGAALQQQPTTWGNKKNNQTFALASVKLATPLAAGATVVLTLKTVFTHTMTPYPASISQAEKQLVRYFDNHYFASPYPTQTQTTTVKLPSSQIESRSDQSPSSSRGDTITYGPYEDVAAFSYSPMTLHFENNKPFLTVTSLVKEIEVSHWSNVAVEETYHIQHDGAALKGTFSRYDYQRTQGQAPAHIPVMRQVLPIQAADVYYRDEIGNISTSHLAYTDNGAVLDLTPRFPLFGGWKFGFYMGYNLPSSAVLGTDTADSSRWVLNITLGSDIDQACVDDLTVRIILPEGAKNPQVYSNVQFDSEDKSKLHYTYLDTTGRPVIELKRKNVVSEHNQYFQVTYNFGAFSMFQEPFLIIGAFLLFFAAIMAYVRFEFNVGNKKIRSAAASAVDDLLLRFQDIMETRFDLHQSLDRALESAVGSKNVTAFNTERARLEATLNKAKREVSDLIADVEKLDGGAEVARKLKEIEAKQEKRVAAQAKLLQTELAHKVDRKLAKADYDKQYPEQRGLFTSLDQEIAGDVSDLTEDM